MTCKLKPEERGRCNSENAGCAVSIQRVASMLMSRLQKGGIRSQDVERRGCAALRIDGREAHMRSGLIVRGAQTLED